MWSWRAHARRQVGNDAQRIAPMTVANKLVHRGEHEVSRKPLRREGRSVSACTCGPRALAQFLCAGAPGAAATRSSLRPLPSGGTSFSAQLGPNPPRERARMEISLRRAASGPVGLIRSAILTLFWHCGYSQFSFRRAQGAGAGNQPSTVFADDSRIPRVWQC